MSKQLVETTQAGSKYTLMTGATGLVGRYLMRDLLSKGHRLAVIVRPSRKETASERIEAIMQMWEQEANTLLPRPVCIEGNLTDPRCGTSVVDQQWIANHCDRMIHSAAVLKFHGPCRTSEPWNTNINGSREVLALCKECGLDDLHYVSTAYVCGARTDLVYEDDLDCQQSFRNDYEESKFEAEKLIRSAEHIRRLTVYRPAVISGDSETGYTNTYHGLHVYLRLIAMLVPMESPDQNGIRHTPIRLPMNGDEPRNVIPVDWVSKVICHLLESPAAWNKTFHLAPDHAITPRQVVEYCYNYFNSTGVEYGANNIEESSSCQSQFEASFLENIKMYESYDHTDPQFDCTNLKHFAGHILCPVIDEPMVHRYLDFGKRDQWGKKKQEKTVIPFCVGSHLKQLCQTSAIDEVIHGFQSNNGGVNGASHSLNGCNGNGHHANGSHTVIGLDVFGPGGGQWHLKPSSRNGYQLEAGIPHATSTVLRLSSRDIQQVVAQPAIK